MKCPLCGQRKARRACPALGHDICAVCCGTKRLTQISCPPDCPYLAVAREHPPAVALRQQERDVSQFMHMLRDLSERQSELLFALLTFVAHRPVPAQGGDLQALQDVDVMDAAAALAATFETSARGVIYEHRPSSLPAERLAAALKPLLAQAGQQQGTVFEREAAVVLRRLEESVRAAAAAAPDQRRAFLEWLGRVVKERAATADEGPAEPRLIVP